MAVVGGSLPHLERCSKVAKALYKTRDHKPAAGSSWAGSHINWNPWTLSSCLLGMGSKH